MDCLFCAIVAGDIPSRQIYSDEHAIAFLDISPWHRGHSLVIPRRHVADLVDTPPALAEIAPAIQATSRLLLDRLGAEGLNMVANTGEAAGQEVFHFHVHLVPRYAGHTGMRNLVKPDPEAGSDLDGLQRLLTS
ncbi:HIT family protein [Ammonicoccus fulvus]|uniref:HIT family protein n=1 Tax=Ammonicoccus fulvus TaxID=3138240 RepID=A0ABZ3FPK2_9ACTN